MNWRCFFAIVYFGAKKLRFQESQLLLPTILPLIELFAAYLFEEPLHSGLRFTAHLLRHIRVGVHGESAGIVP